MKIAPANIRLVAIVGPTAAGKTALSLDLAAEAGGEIISADSRQIYRGMDIGTAKATPSEQARVPHHMIDVVDPGEVLTAAEYQAAAYALIAEISARDRVPFLVGGTGQYVRAVLEGWQIPRVEPNPELRAELFAQAEAEGPEALHARLAAMDPLAAQRIDYRNVRRVVRALEVSLIAGQPISELQRKSPPPYWVLQFGVTRPRPELYARIDARVDRMVADGLVDEVRHLHDAGYDWGLPAMTGLGYRQIGQYLRAEITLEEAVALIKKETRRFVRQQSTWFRLDDSNIHWIDPEEVALPEVRSRLRAFLNLP